MVLAGEYELIAKYFDEGMQQVATKSLGSADLKRVRNSTITEVHSDIMTRHCVILMHRPPPSTSVRSVNYSLHLIHPQVSPPSPSLLPAA